MVGELGEPDLRQQSLDVDRPATLRQAPHDVVADPHTQYLRLRPLENHGSAARPAERAVTGPQHLSGGGTPATDDPGERGLPGPVAPQDRHELRWPDGERHIVDGVPRGPRVAVRHRFEPHGKGPRLRIGL